jgi:hypothetical protein
MSTSHLKKRIIAQYDNIIFILKNGVMETFTINLAGYKILCSCDHSGEPIVFIKEGQFLDS